MPDSGDPRDPYYRFHRKLGLCVCFFLLSTAAIAMIVGLLKLMMHTQDYVGLVLACTSFAGFALTGAFWSLSYVRQVECCYVRCRTREGFAARAGAPQTPHILRGRLISSTGRT
jgi:hypothetical protein